MTEADGADLPAERLRLAALSAAVAGVIVWLAAVARQAGVPKVDTLWAEDGTIFLHCAYGASPLACFGEPYQGYLHLLPRAIAAVAAAADPSIVALAVTVLAATVAALAAAAAGWSIAEATGSPVAGVVGASGLGLVWQAGREVLGNAANLHWVLLGASLIVIACIVIGARVRVASIVLVAATGLTSALSPLLAVLALGPLLLRRRRGIALLGTAAVAGGIQAVVELTSRRATPPGAAVDLGDVLRFGRDQVLRDGFFGPAPLAVGASVVAGTGVLLVLLTVAVADRRSRWRDAGAIAALVVLGAAICIGSIVANRSLNPRYAYMPAVLVVAAAGLAAGLLARQESLLRRTSRARVLPWGLAIVFALGFVPSFRLDARASAGPAVPPQVSAAAAHCQPGVSATILISPRPASTDWTLALPCSRLGPR